MFFGLATVFFQLVEEAFDGFGNRASAYGTPLDGATVKVVITTVNKT